MSIELEIYSNHNLRFNNYFEGIDLIEKHLNIKIEDLATVQKNSHEEKKIQFFTNHDFFSTKFNENHEIYLMTNLNFLESIIVNKHFMRFNFVSRVNSKYHIWEKFISKIDYYELSNEQQEKFSEVLEEWNEIRNFIKKITSEMGGINIFYLNDGDNFSLIKDLILENNALDIVLNQLNSISSPIKYSDLEKGMSDFYNDDNWYIENLEN